MFRKTIFMVIISISFFVEGMAQNSSAGINIMLGYPQGEFKSNVDFLLGGFSLQYLYRPDNNIPISLGLNLGYLNYGSESKNQYYRNNYSGYTTDMKRTNNLVNFHVLAQIGPSKGLFRPYLEALLGGSYLFTETEITDKYSYFDEDYDVSSKNDLNDFAWSYGGGGGVAFYLARLEDEENSEMGIVDLFLDFKIRYLYGSKARYMKEGSMQVINGNAVYDIYESKTDILTFQLGITIYF